jgi:hypothetical protein
MATEPTSISLSAQALSRLTSMYQNATKFQTWLSGLAGLGQGIDNVLIVIPTLLDYTVAAGVSLDKVGELVGQPRLLPNGNRPNDAEYRILIGARIARNTCTTTGEGIIAVLALLFGATIQLIDFGGMELQYFIGRPPTADEVSVLTTENDLLPRPMGVLINQAFTEDATGYFGFDDDVNALGMAEESDPTSVDAGTLAEGF